MNRFEHIKNFKSNNNLSSTSNLDLNKNSINKKPKLKKDFNNSKFNNNNNNDNIFLKSSSNKQIEQSPLENSLANIFKEEIDNIFKKPEKTEKNKKIENDTNIFKKKNKKTNQNIFNIEKINTFFDNIDIEETQEPVDINDTISFPTLNNKEIKKQIKEETKEETKENYKNVIYNFLNKPEDEDSEDEDEEEIKRIHDYYYYTFPIDIKKTNLIEQQKVINFINYRKKYKLRDMNTFSDLLVIASLEEQKLKMTDNQFKEWLDYFDEEHPNIVSIYNNYLKQQQKEIDNYFSSS